MTVSISCWGMLTSQVGVPATSAVRLYAQVDFVSVAAWAVRWEPRREIRRPSDVVFAAVDEGFVAFWAEPDV